MQSSYITESGNEFDNRAFADVEQNAVDDYKRSLTVDGQLQDAYAERERLNEEVRKRMEEIDNKPYQGFADFMRQEPDQLASMMPLMPNIPTTLYIPS